MLLSPSLTIASLCGSIHKASKYISLAFLEPIKIILNAKTHVNKNNAKKIAGRCVIKRLHLHEINRQEGYIVI